MEVFRISRAKYAGDLSGIGAEKFGGRWNSKGVAMLYTSQSRALAMAEVAVHFSLSILPADFCIATIEISNDAKIKELVVNKIPNGWDSIPHNDTTQKIGDKFIADNEFVCLKVPSVIVRGDYNYLINPKHKYFNKIKIVKTEAFYFDKRFFK